MENQRVLVGLAQPFAASLDSHFYPQDFPPEWRLTFVHNRFACVYLNRTSLESLDWGDWLDMLEEMDDASGVFLLDEDVRSDARLVDKLIEMRVDIEWIAPQDCLLIEECLSPKALADRLKATFARKPPRLVCLSHKGQCPAMIEQTRPLIELLGY